MPYIPYLPEEDNKYFYELPNEIDYSLSSIEMLENPDKAVNNSNNHIKNEEIFSEIYDLPIHSEIDIFTDEPPLY